MWNMDEFSNHRVYMICTRYDYNRSVLSFSFTQGFKLMPVDYLIIERHGVEFHTN